VLGICRPLTDVTQEEDGIALLHEGRTRPVCVTHIAGRVQSTRAGALASDIVKVVVPYAAAQIVALVDLPFGTDLRTQQPFVFAGAFGQAVAIPWRVGVFQRIGTQIAKD